MMDLETEKLIVSLKKYLVVKLANDIEIITLAQKLSTSNGGSCVFVDEYNLLKGVVCSDIKIKKNFSPVYFAKWKIIFCLRGLLFLKRMLWGRRKEGLNSDAGIKIIFEQMYNGQEENPEFKAFYRYFKERNDVLYICVSEDSEIYKTLKGAQKPVLLKGKVQLLHRNRLSHIKPFVMFLIRIVLSLELKSFLLKESILRLFEEKCYYEAMFSSYKPSCYLKVRSDMVPSHPIATAVAQKYNIKHIGYQHGSYIFQAIFAYIDFHYYGLLGKCFIDGTFSETWPSNIQYRILGPIIAEVLGKNKINNKKNDRLVIVVFTTATESNNHEWHSSYKRYVGILCQTLSDLNKPNLHIIFKEKGYRQWSAKLIVDLCRKYGLSYEIAYHGHPSAIPSINPDKVVKHVNNHGINIHFDPGKVKVFFSSEEAIVMADIVVGIAPYGCSTTIFEALGKKKKLVTFGSEYHQNSFSKYVPELVVMDKNEFEYSIKWLLNIPQKEYEEKIRFVIENCSKVSNGNLVRDFMVSVEKAYYS